MNRTHNNDARISMDTTREHTSADDNDIELVDIDDLRAAFGGEGFDPAPEQQAGIYAPTRMCSGWN